MASMNFDSNTVSMLMNMVDDHKENIKEVDYIKICNAMKVLHYTVHQPTPTPVQHQPTPTPVRRRLFTDDPLYSDLRNLETDSIRILYLRENLRKIDLESRRNLRIINEDKLGALTYLMREHDIEIPIVLRISDTQKVKIFEEAVSVVVSHTVRNRKYREFKTSRIESTRQHLMEQNDIINTEISILQRNIHDSQSLQRTDY